MPATRRRASPRQVLKCGPFRGVKNETDPIDDDPDFLQDAVNMYIPDATGGSGLYERPGTVLMNAANQLGGPNHMGQCVYHHTALNGLEYNFMAISGKLYRVSADLTIYTDVTPVGPVIDGATSTRVFMLSFADQLVVSDGVNRPWLGTNLASTPITGTNIQYDAGNSAWSAQHMTVYSGALVFALKTLAGVFKQTRIVWSAPNDPTQGYFNTVGGLAVDYTWDLVQTGTTPIYALCGTNIALIYWRDYAMGALSGAIGPTFKNSSTHDAIDFKIGTQAPATIALHGNTIFFADSDGRPQMLPLGNRLVPIWLGMRAIVETSRTDTPASTALTAVGTLFSPLNLYLVALWSPLPTINMSAKEIYAFDALTGTHVGRWVVGPGISIETLGIMKDQNGQPELAVIGTKVTAIGLGFGGYVWRLANVQENIWTDNGVTATVWGQTLRLGFEADKIKYADRATAITGSTAPVDISLTSAEALEASAQTDTLLDELTNTLTTESGDTLMAESVVSATATPYPVSYDGTYRANWGVDIAGRGFNVTLRPTTTTSQWRFYSFELTAVSSDAPTDEV